MSSDNVKIFDAAIKRAKEQIMQKLAQRAFRKGCQIVDIALGEKEYMGFTGQSQTSYTAMVLDKKGATVYSSGDFQREPVFRKINQDEVVTLAEPYEGDERTVKGEAEILDSSNDATIRKIASEPHGALTLRMAVGVEYHEYLPGDDPIEVMYNHAMQMDGGYFR